jgi:hypothetical protein
MKIGCGRGVQPEVLFKVCSSRFSLLGKNSVKMLYPAYSNFEVSTEEDYEKRYWTA